MRTPMPLSCTVSCTWPVQFVVWQVQISFWGYFLYLLFGNVNTLTLKVTFEKDIHSNEYTAQHIFYNVCQYCFIGSQQQGSDKITGRSCKSKLAWNDLCELLEIWLTATATATLIFQSGCKVIEKIWHCSNGYDVHVIKMTFLDPGLPAKGSKCDLSSESSRQVHIP